MTAKYGLAVFQNFLNSDMQPNHVRSMCCRLQLDLRELLKRGNGLFGSAEQTGSLGVVTINCARLGYLHAERSRKRLFARLGHLADMARDSLEIKRKVVQRLMDDGLFPYTKRYLGTLRNHFSTIGVNGVQRAGSQLHERRRRHQPAGRPRAGDPLARLPARTAAHLSIGDRQPLQPRSDAGQGTTYRFAREDRKRYPDILQAGTADSPYYINSTQLPVGFTDDPFDALQRQDELQTRYTGGTVLHLYMRERISSAVACRKLVQTALSRFRLPYITITPTFSICPKHGYLDGEHEFCPRCDEEAAAGRSHDPQTVSPI